VTAAAGPPVPAGPTPTVLRSLSSAVLLDRRGDVELDREARGASMDWGGVFAQQVRLSGAWRLTIEHAGGAFGLPGTLTDASVDGERFRSDHRCGEVSVAQTIVPLASPPGTLRSLRLLWHGARPLPVVVTSAFAPFLLPVLVEGIRPVDFQLATRAGDLRVRHRGFALSFCADVLPSRLYVDRASWRGGRRRGPLEEVGSDHELLLVPGGTTELRFALVGGLERDLDRALAETRGPLVDPEEVARRLAEAEAAWRATTPEMALPDAPELERAYDQARSALRRLYTSPGDGFTGLVAGYPWYSAVWCRDLAWMLPALLWLGDFAWVRASIDSVLRFQATRDLPLLGGEPGELPMQISPGPVFLFGTSDTTLYYPSLIERAVRHAGGRELPPGWADAVDRVVGWGERRSDARSGLLRHGGEVEDVGRSAFRFARTRYGIDAPDTTIWDSTDRRDHAIDVQVLWSSALRAAAAFARRAGTEADRERLEGLAGRVEAAVRSRYPWPEEGYLYDSIREGRPVGKVRPNALRAVSAGLVDAATAATVVRRAAADDLTSPWGVRTLSSRDPSYSPTAYHDGQVWTIATAWAADAAYAAGEADLGLAYLRTIAARLAAEGGLANECYRGDRAEPFDSCFLLGLSVGPFLAVLFERLWGLRVDASRPELAVRPAFPPTWRAASLERLRIGEGLASLRFRQGALEVGWQGTAPLTVVGPRGRTTVDPGARVVLAGP
jgi:glycogen debranching enzyme